MQNNSSALTPAPVIDVTPTRTFTNKKGNVVPIKGKTRIPRALNREPIWEQQFGESQIAFSYFKLFRDMINERRTFKKVAEKAHRQVKRIEYLAKIWRWPERVYAYDLELDAIERREVREMLKAANKENAGIAFKMKQILLKKLKAMDEDEISDKSVPTWLKAISDIEARAFNGVTERIEHETAESRHMKNVAEAQRAYNEGLQMFKSYDREKLKVMIAQQFLISPAELRDPGTPANSAFTPA